MKQVPTLKPKHPEQRINPDKEKTLNLKGIVRFNDGKYASILILNEREGGLGIEISSNIIKTKNLQIGDTIYIETIINNKETKIPLVIKHIKKINGKHNKSYIGLQYAKGNKLSLLDKSFTI